MVYFSISFPPLKFLLVVFHVNYSEMYLAVVYGTLQMSIRSSTFIYFYDVFIDIFFCPLV